MNYSFPEFHALAKRANWKILLLHILAKVLNVSIHIEGMPWGAPGGYLGVMSSNVMSGSQGECNGHH